MFGEAGLGATDRPQYGRLGHDTTHDTAKGGHDTASSAHTRGLAGGECHDTKFCIVARERGLAAGGCVTIQSMYRDRREVG